MRTKSWILVLSFPFLMTACGQKERPIQEIDYVGSKLISDAAAQDLVASNSKDLMSRLDVGFTMLVKDENDLKKVLKKMDDEYGRPTEFLFKIAQPGIREDGAFKRPKRTFWYQVKTLKHPKGDYYLKVEVCRAFSSDTINVSGFGIFTFKDKSRVPDFLK